MRAYLYRPASVTRFKGTLDASGLPVSFIARVASPSLMDPTSQVGLPKLPPDGIDIYAVEGVRDVPYDIPNVRVEYSRQEPGVPVWFWRSVGHSQNTFFSESFIDELANAAGRVRSNSAARCSGSSLAAEPFLKSRLKRQDGASPCLKGCIAASRSRNPSAATSQKWPRCQWTRAASRRCIASSPRWIAVKWSIRKS